MSTTFTAPPEPDERMRALEDELHHVEEELVVEHERNDSRALITWVSVALVVGALLITAAVLVIGAGGGGNADSAPNTSAPADSPVAVTPPASESPAPKPTAISFEKFAPVDPALPTVPAGPVKKFRVDVYEHVTKVSDDLPATKVWSFGVNSKLNRGTGASTPIVVNQGDKVQITLVNGGSKASHVTFNHSIDFHSAEVAPNLNYTDIAPGKTKVISFTAKHPGVFMYHCATKPVLMHTAAGMVGMMVVKPRNLPPVDKELYVTQQEFYVGQPGGNVDMKLAAAEAPNAITFNGYANQYTMRPITVRKGERIRMYVLNAGPSKWTAFHVIGTVFDRTMIEGQRGHDAQTVNLAPSQGGWVEFTLDHDGNYPFVTHSFGDMVKGAAGILHTSGAPAPKATH